MSRTSFLEDKRAQPRELAVALVCALLLTTGVGMASPAAPAAVITVTGAADDADISNLAGNGMCDLREAITAANTDAPVGECPGGSSADTIQFSVTTPVTITLGAALPPITGTLTISGPGRSALGIDGADLYRPFWIETGATAEISGMTLARGYAPTTGPSQYRGGAVFNRGTLTLRNVSILDSNGISYGGGIHNEGALTLEGVLVAGCSSATYGGGVQGEPGSLLVIDHDSQIGAPGRPNVASLYGAGIYLDRATAVISGAISYNSSGNVGGGLYCEGSTVTLQNATIESNTAGQGGGIHSSNSVLTIISSRIVSNTALFGGWYGGLDVVTSQVELTRSAVVSNTASGAAGIGVSADSVVTLTHSVVLYNTSVDGSGGGVLVYGEGTLTLDSSTVANNATLNSEGGGVNVLPGGAAIIRNSTISGNSAAGYAGGINARGLVTMTHSTIVDNVTDSDDDGSGDGGGISRYDGQIWIAHTLIANNVDRGGEYPDCFNRNNSSLFASQGYNLAEVPCFTSAAGDITGQDPRLGPLQDNGGPAMAEGWALLTHALGAGSPARDVGNLTFAPPPAYDQRGSGFPRAVGRVDIGAFEAWAATALPLILRQ